ncbi:hypothetical protein Are01nite_24310 [Actinoplanes regularis]|nr:hypothetical protein Are01nite_24310 [Actinoplanes regularis]
MLIVAAVSVTMYGCLPAPGAIWAILRTADVRWVVAALAAQVVSQAAFALQQRHLLRAAGVTVSPVTALAITYSRSAISLVLPAGSAVSAAYAVQQYRRRGATAATAATVTALSLIASMTGLLAVCVLAFGPTVLLTWWHSASYEAIAAAVVLISALITAIRTRPRNPRPAHPNHLPSATDSSGQLPSAANGAASLLSTMGGGGPLPSQTGGGDLLPSATGGSGQLPSAAGGAGLLLSAMGGGGSLPSQRGGGGLLPSAMGGGGSLPSQRGGGGLLPSATDDSGQQPSAAGSGGSLLSVKEGSGSLRAAWKGGDSLLPVGLASGAFRKLAARIRREWTAAVTAARSIRPRDGATAVLWSALNWAADAFCLVAAAQACDLPAGWRTVGAAYLVAQVVRQIPLSPGGLGFVEASLVTALSMGAFPAVATAAVLGYRLVSFWLILPVGLLTYLGLRRIPARPIGFSMASVLRPRVPAALVESSP